MKILIPLDGSKFAEDVLGPALKLAEGTSGTAEVHLLRVVKAGEAHTTWRRPPPNVEDIGGAWSPIGPLYSPETLAEGATVENKGQSMNREHNEAMDYLQHLAAGMAPVKVHTEVVFGDDPAESILWYAKSEKVDLIAMATHGHTGLARMLLGSVAGKLLRAKVAPVYMVRPNALDEKGAAKTGETAAKE